ncbi:MAG: hypothetical protein LBD84_06305 [Campylobacteraceae bacterium]|jgi:hypothetical protein|nr:hypothetical protein [Campylobacteraceae bacterium]
MNNSRRFFIKMGIFLAALLFIGGCNSTETSTVTTEYDGFSVEYDKDKRIINLIHTSDKEVMVVLENEGNHTRRLMTIEGKTILDLADNGGEHELKYTSKRIKFSKNDDGNAILTLLPL